MTPITNTWSGVKPSWALPSTAALARTSLMPESSVRSSATIPVRMRPVMTARRDDWFAALADGVGAEGRSYVAVRSSVADIVVSCWICRIRLEPLGKLIGRSGRFFDGRASRSHVARYTGLARGAALGSGESRRWRLNAGTLRGHSAVRIAAVLLGPPQAPRSTACRVEISAATPILSSTIPNEALQGRDSGVVGAVVFRILNFRRVVNPGPPHYTL